jgi:PEP-CTERM motif
MPPFDHGHGGPLFLAEGKGVKPWLFPADFKGRGAKTPAKPSNERRPLVKRRTQWLLLPAVLVGLAAQSANASVTFFNTPPGSVDGAGEPVNAAATFTTGTDTLTIVLQDLQADPTSAGQLLTDLFFTLNTGENVGTLTSGTSSERTVNADGTFTDGGVVAAGWVLSTSGSGFLLDVLAGPGHAGPAHALIGPPNGGTGIYSNANASIAGNGPHNPFLNQSATFVLNIPGVTMDSFVNSATFSVGTAAGDNIPGVQTPEPASLALMGIGLGSMGLISLGRRRAKKIA